MLHETRTKCSKDGAYLLHIAESLPQPRRHGLYLPLGSRSLNSTALSTSWPARNGELDRGVWNKQRQGYFPAALFRRSCIGSAERCLHLSAQFPGHLAFPSGSGERAWLREFPWAFSPRPAPSAYLGLPWGKPLAPGLGWDVIFEVQLRKRQVSVLLPFSSWPVRQITSEFEALGRFPWCVHKGEKCRNTAI